MEKIRNMPIGIQDFPSMIEGNYVYVDKTHFIPMLEKVGRAYFLSRPRRFGKSLFISTLQAYFEGQKELFKGLFIEKYKKEKGEEWQTYPVLKLDLNAQKYTQEEHLATILNDHINDWCKKYDIRFDIREPSIAFATIIKELYKKFNKKVVILIDEYEAPLLNALQNGYHKEALDFFRTFYSSALKTNPYLEKGILTGITKISQASIFSGLNNFIVYDYNKDEFSDTFGFTQDEVNEALKYYNLEPNKELIKDWVDRNTPNLSKI